MWLGNAISAVTWEISKANIWVYATLILNYIYYIILILYILYYIYTNIKKHAPHCPSARPHTDASLHGKMLCFSVWASMNKPLKLSASMYNWYIIFGDVLVCNIKCGSNSNKTKTPPLQWGWTARAITCVCLGDGKGILLIRPSVPLEGSFAPCFSNGMSFSVLETSVGLWTLHQS